MKKFLYLLSALVLSACAGEKTVPVLHVEGGDIQGVTTEKEGVYVYKGIPYAAPPIGENRWRAPQPVVAWEVVRMCLGKCSDRRTIVLWLGMYALCVWIPMLWSMTSAILCLI